MKQDEENDKELSISAKNSARVKELEIQISQLKNDINRLEQEKATDSKKYKEATTKINQYEKKVTGLKAKLEEANNRIAHLQHELEITNRTLRETEIELMDMQTQYAHLTNEYEEGQKHHDRRVAKCNLLAGDNELLRAQIAELSNAQDPIHEEEFYTREFDQIGMEISSWAAKETSNMSKEPLSPSSKDLIISRIKLCGIHGSVSATKSLDPSSSNWNSNRRDRIALIRHILAIFLFDNVFDRFSFGLERDTSEYFQIVETNLWNKGISIGIQKITKILIGGDPLAKILTVRQSIGKAMISMQAENVEPLKSRLTEDLITILRALLSNSKEERLKSFAAKTMDKTIRLRNAMTKEQAIYRCSFVDYGEKFDKSLIQVAPGEDEAGLVVMCLFPGLHCLTLDDDGEPEFKFIPIVKATAKSELSVNS